jgi:hypothetical protein
MTIRQISHILRVVHHINMKHETYDAQITRQAGAAVDACLTRKALLP